LKRITLVISIIKEFFEGLDLVGTDVAKGMASRDESERNQRLSEDI
jgi:hypothetical protein